MTFSDPAIPEYTEIRAYLRVDGSTEEAIIKCLGLEPSKKWRRGDSIQGTLLKRKADGFTIEFDLPVGSSFSDHVRNILERVHPRHACLSTCKLEGIKLAVVVEIHGCDRPPMQCDASLIQMLADIGASLDVDLYTF